MQVSWKVRKKKMPKYKYGDMFKKLGKENSLFVVTTNSYTRNDGCLVMGRGAAKQLADKRVSFPIIAGVAIKEFEKRHKHRQYHFLTFKSYGEFVGILQVKIHFKEKSKLWLIEESIRIMDDFVNTCTWIEEVNMNYPGIGFGGLEKKKVKPLLKSLDERFNIWQFKK